ncbi:hypothetical protein PENTCL1PPCAC_28513, partial [Pristionchus entomophagus]
SLPLLLFDLSHSILDLVSSLLPPSSLLPSMRAYDFVTHAPLQLDQHRSFLIDDIALTRPSPPLSPFIGSGSSSSGADPLQRDKGMIERCVVVQRQKDGYGLTVTGEHPLYVYTVRPDGAAFCAGVRQGDRILKVNGMPVTSSNYADVVRMISDGQNVALTLLGKAPDHLEIKGDPDYKTPDIKSIKSIEQLRDSYLAPQMLSPEERAVNRRQTIERMLEDERRNIQGLRFTNEKKEKLDQALQRVERLKSQLSLKSDASWMHSSATAELLAHEGGDSDDDDLSITHPVSSSSPSFERRTNQLDTQIPFTSLIELKSRPAHLALFIEYLIANSNPAGLFFYLITDAYQTCTATAKELRRWAFEIFSTFLVPNGPLGVSHEQSILTPIDKMLNSTTTHVTEGEGEKLRKIFSAARQRAIVDINDHLNDFRQRKDMGMETSFEASKLASMSRGDLSMEQKLGESKLMKQLEVLLNSSNNEYDNCEPKTQAIISSIATVIKVVLAMKPSATQWERMLEKFPTFLMKEKNSKFKMKTSTPKRNLQVKGHVFSFNPVNVVHYCYQCRDAIWGIQANGYFCLNCDVVVHKKCTSTLSDSCYPATQKKATKKGGMARSVREDDEEGGRVPAHEHNVKSTSSDSGIGYEVIERRGDVARSQSMKSRLSHMTTTTLSEDVRLVPRGRSALSWGADLVPAHQLDEMPIRRNALTELGRPAPSDIQSISGASSISHDDDVRRLISSMTENDSDMEVDSEVPTLESLVSWDVVRHLKPKEKKRQEVINELFHTERTHVRNLKILYSIFYQPMILKNTVSQDLLWLFFANIEELLGIHKEMNRKMRDQVEEWRKESSLNGLYGDIGNLMEDLFDGENGEKLKQATSLFCQHQQHALEILRSRCNKKEDHFSRWLADVESHPLCRKLQLKDMLPVEMQRLVKYPMLLETAAKYTQEENLDEQEKLYRVVHESKKILSAVNTAKRNAENLRRLEELQRRMDTTPFDKENSGNDYASLDLTKYHLIHDGHLTMRFSRGKMVELHVILLEEILVLLTRHSDGNKLMLKSLETSKEAKWPPILPISPLIVKEKANDKRAFFLLPISQDSKGAQIVELTAATATERKTWLKLMHDQIEYVKKQPTQGIEPFKFEVGAASVEDEGLGKVQVLTHPGLVRANEITIQQPTVLEHAKAVLTPTERLKRNDQLIFQALLDKQTILANFLPGDATHRAEQLTKLTELLGGLNVADLKQRDPKELAMSAIVHGNRLLDSINQGMQAHKESEDGSTVTLVLDDPDRHLPSVPCYKLTAIGAPLMNHLKALMQVIQSQEAELATVKQQLCRYKDMAEASGCDRSVSEETLTDTQEERKLVTKRQSRAPSVPTCPPPLI